VTLLRFAPAAARLAIAAIVVALLAAMPSALWPAEVAAQTSRDEVRSMLSGVETAATEREWRALGEGAVPVLVAIFDDGSELQPVRLRSVWAARFFSTAASRSFLQRLAADASQPGLVVRAAVQSLAAAFGRSAVPPIAAQLAHADAAVREACIVALGRIGGSEARAALEARRGRELEHATLLGTTLAGLADGR
jgi:HEAT repeat protein